LFFSYQENLHTQLDISVHLDPPKLEEQRNRFENQLPEIQSVHGGWLDEMREFRIGFLVQTVRLQSMLMHLVVVDDLQGEISDH
jgi:hypothetical protein